ncbi:MAG: hypothetical protein O3A25_00300 [Acidobacteria bacterium]|nr:hypothetical protein [Acidobacteriota bacterium]
MMRLSHTRRRARFGRWGLFLVASVLAVAVRADAQQVIGVSVGPFTVAPDSSRSAEDVLRANTEFQTFDIGDFNNVAVGGDWMLVFGEYVEAGAGFEVYQKSVAGTDPTPTSGNNLALDMTVRTISVPITARVFPLRRTGRVQPYVGGGVAIHFWRYTEERVLTSGIFSGRSSAIDQGIALGPVVFGGARVPVGPTLSIGGELRYRAKDARLNGPVFAGTTLDLGGVSTVVTVQFRLP